MQQSCQPSLGTPKKGCISKKELTRSKVSWVITCREGKEVYKVRKLFLLYNFLVKKEKAYRAPMVVLCNMKKKLDV
jgi:hypothetical protein